MAFVREYFPSDTLKLINDSEGKAGMSGEAAHTISRHVRHSPGASSLGGQARHNGVSRQTFASRYEDDPFDNQGNRLLNTGWLGKGDIAILLARVLNSPAGQEALSGLDRGARRAVAQHIFNGDNKVQGRTISAPVAETRTSPSAPTLTYHDNNPRNPLAGQLRSIKTNKPTHKGVIRERDVLGAVAVLDNMGALHIQTFYPILTPGGKSKAEYTHGKVATVAEVMPDGSIWRAFTLMP